MARARPLRYVTASERGRVTGVIEAALAAWQQRWGLEASHASALAPVSCECWSGGISEDGPTGGHRVAGSSGTRYLVEGRSRGLTGEPLAISALSLALFGAAPVGLSRRAPSGVALVEGGEISRELVAAAWEDLQLRLAGALDPTGRGDGTAAAASPAAFGPWSGSLAVSFPWWQARIRVLVPGEAVSRLVPPRAASHAAPAAALVPVWRAVAARRTSLRVRLQTFEIELGALGVLRKGDVVRTTQPLDQPLEVAVDVDPLGPALVCAAFLGRAGPVRAVELVPAARVSVGEPRGQERPAGNPEPRRNQS